MKLYIGGCGAGQKELAAKETGLEPVDVSPVEALSAKAVNNFHLITKELAAEGKDIQAYARKLAEKNPDVVIVSDEIGNGIHPFDRNDRIWREETGRALCIIASHAESVIRVYCGIGQKIK